jgi:hypothetical protein
MYQEYPVKLNDLQISKLRKAIGEKSAVSFRVSPDQMGVGDNKLKLTPTQIKRMEKAKAAGKGLVLSMSKAQISQSMVGGGFMVELVKGLAGPLLGELAKPIASGIGNKVGSLIRGNGVMEPVLMAPKKKAKMVAKHAVEPMEAQGLMIPGSGLILPGQRGGFLPLLAAVGAPLLMDMVGRVLKGSGLIVPGTSDSAMKKAIKKTLKSMETDKFIIKSMETAEKAAKLKPVPEESLENPLNHQNLKLDAFSKI